jgi:hypothetical protein
MKTHLFARRTSHFLVTEGKRIAAFHKWSLSRAPYGFSGDWGTLTATGMHAVSSSRTIGNTRPLALSAINAAKSRGALVSLNASSSVFSDPLRHVVCALESPVPAAAAIAATTAADAQ